MSLICCHFKQNSRLWFLIRVFDLPVKAALGMSLRKVSHKTFVFSVFSRNQGKMKPLTWLSVSSLPPSRAAQNLATSL